MFTRMAALTAVALMVSAPVFASTSPSPVPQTIEQCQQLFELTKQTAQNNDIGQKAQEQVDELLKSMQDQCSASQFEAADQTAALVRGLVATE